MIQMERKSSVTVSQLLTVKNVSTVVNCDPFYNNFFVCLPFFFDLFGREWYVNGNYLVVIVSCSVILPLALMKQLGKFSQTSDSYV